MQIRFENNVTLCTDKSQVCDALSWRIVHGIFDIPCFLLNLLHLIIILQMKSLQKNLCLRALYIHMAVAGMLNGLVTFLRSNCFLMRNMLDQPSVIVMTVAMLFDWPGAAKYYIVCFGSYDRYISICRPMYKPSNFLLNNFNRSLIFLWMILITAMMSLGILWNDKACVMGNSGPTLLFGLTNLFSPIAAGVTCLPCLITTILTSFVAAELRRMMRRVQPGLMQQQDRDMINVTKCLIIIMLTMVLCLIPVCVSIILWSYEPTRHLIAGSTLSLSYLLFMSHGIFDTFVFGWMIPAFRRQGLHLLAQIRQRICSPFQSAPSASN